MTGPNKVNHTVGRRPPSASQLRDSSAKFTLSSPFSPRGDQPQAISKLHAGLEQGAKYQTLLGITGSGKTYTIANVIEKQNRPALVIAPNKTLAAQLYAEFREFFPENRVRYFVSYYDYYQPEAYLPATDTYIEKDSAINEEIDKMRHSATRALLEARDVIIVASVSCIYGLGAPEDYFKMMLFGEKGEILARKEVVRQLVRMQYRRGDISFERGHFRARGDTIDIFPSDEDSRAIRLQYFGDELEEIREIDALSGATIRKLSRFAVYPVSHFVTNEDAVKKAIISIRKELFDWLPRLRNEGKVLEAQRLEQRTLYDLELLEEVGFCPGIENYSRHLSGREEGSPPTTLIDYFPDDFLLVIDESHVTVPQLGAMYRGDRSRKQTLVNYGFRLPSAMDNRPLSADEFWSRVGQTIFVSATPGDREVEWSKGSLVEQLNRPTGLLDPQIIVKPAANQIDDLLGEIKSTIEKGDRVLVTTLTKRTAEKISEYLRTIGVKARYLHSDINAIERVELIRGLRSGEFDVLIGINLLREGLDLVEVSLVAILDADKEGFLRSTRSLIQTMGRAARHLDGRAILYADKITDSMAEAIDVTEKRREIQTRFNEENGITPVSARRPLEPTLTNEEISEKTAGLLNEVIKGQLPANRRDQEKFIESLRKAMFKAAADKNFEKAAELRDAIGVLQKELLLC